MVVGSGGDKVLSFCGLLSDIKDAGVPWISWPLRAPSVVCEATVMPREAETHAVLIIFNG